MSKQLVKITIKGKEYKGEILEKKADKYKIQIEGLNKADWFEHKEFKRIW